MFRKRLCAHQPGPPTPKLAISELFFLFRAGGLAVRVSRAAGLPPVSGLVRSVLSPGCCCGGGLVVLAALPRLPVSAAPVPVVVVAAAVVAPVSRGMLAPSGRALLPADGSVVMANGSWQTALANGPGKWFWQTARLALTSCPCLRPLPAALSAAVCCDAGH